MSADHEFLVYKRGDVTPALSLLRQKSSATSCEVAEGAISY
jgi:hypothetical protein